MLRLMCKSKIHRATLTKVDLHYEGSIGIDSLVLKAANIYPGEIVQVVNINNAARFETYVIEEKAGSGTIGLYGAAAHLGNAGDLVIILSYAFIEDKKARGFKINPVYVDPNNKIINPSTSQSKNERALRVDTERRRSIK
ncbi:MAG: aspartate 1-decarboxylase [Candidatus Omnitrophota bacterium]